MTGAHAAALALLLAVLLAAMVLHAAGPAQDDVVLVTDEAVVAALAEGRITASQARAQGLVKTYGTRESVERLSALLDRSFE